MISPLLVFPEQFAETAKRTDEKDAAVSRMLVLLDPERPIKYPLFKETMTIGRADVADIQINNGFLSRLHARIVTTAEGVVVEDIESKNGIRVNAKATERQTLRHGDIIDFGRLRFRFLDTGSEDTE
jgi:pSer/pThr/pTyr-binding forkhead associated (FHA) protein